MVRLCKILFLVFCMLFEFVGNAKHLRQNEDFDILAYKLENSLCGSCLTDDSSWVLSCDYDGKIGRTFDFLHSKYKYDLTFMPATTLLVVENMSSEDMAIDNCYTASWEFCVEGNCISDWKPMLGPSRVYFYDHKISQKSGLGIVAAIPRENGEVCDSVMSIKYEPYDIALKSFNTSTISQERYIPRTLINVSNANRIVRNCNENYDRDVRLSIVKLANFSQYRTSDRLLMPVITTRNNDNGFKMVNEEYSFVPAGFGLIVSNNSDKFIELEPFYSSKWEIVVKYKNGNVHNIPLCSRKKQHGKTMNIDPNGSVAIVFGFMDLIYKDFDELQAINVLYNDEQSSIVSNILVFDD